MHSSRKQTTVIRQVLKEIISDTNATTQRSTTDLEKVKLREAVIFLERKIERQNCEIKVLADQLCNETNLKEQLLVLLNDQKEKTSKLSGLLTNCNKATAELKKKVGRLEQQQVVEQGREDYEKKLNKYRQIVRKKDEQLLKNQLRLDDLQKNERTLIELERDIKQLRESFSRLKNREESLTAEVQSYKKRLAQAQDKITDKQYQLKQQSQQCLLAQEKIKRLQLQLQQLEEEHEKDHEQTKAIEEDMKRLLDRQNQEIRRMSEAQAAKREKPEWELSIYINEVRRILSGHLKDGHLRRKVQKEVMCVIEEMEGSFNKILAHMINNLP